MAPPRKFDHDEARRLRAEGMTYTEIARRVGVSQTAVVHVCNEKSRRRMHAASHRRHEELRMLCLGGCGTRVWASTHRDATGYCQKCLGAKLREEHGPLHGTETGYAGRGCRCDDCRRASAEARRRRRARAKVAA